MNSILPIVNGMPRNKLSALLISFAPKIANHSLCPLQTLIIGSSLYAKLMIDKQMKVPIVKNVIPMAVLFISISS